MLSGGLGMLQTGSIVAAFPFAFIMIFAMWAMIKALKADAAVEGVVDINSVADVSVDHMDEEELAAVEEAK